VPTSTLLIAAAASAMTGLAFVVVGLRVRTLSVSDEYRGPQLAHALWWICLGAYLLLQAGLTAAAGFGALDAAVYLASRALAIPLLCIAVWGLCSYLAFLYTGSHRARVMLGILYAVVAIVFASATFVQRPQMRIDDWLVGYEDDSLLYQAVYVLVGLPPIIASIAYLTLLRRVREPDRQRRLLLTSVGILAYVGSGLSARLFGNDVAAFVTLVPLGILSAAAILAAHVLTPTVRVPRAGAPQRHAIEDAGLAQRLRELI
jgi:hypothetical protein